ncbi:MAG TPA: Uma2 family endonuclease [Blastocatellia bacterium]|nr:Uma2 family endonuclease [Blastocatellia bacterium]
MASQTKPRYTPEEYLAIERNSEVKSEYFDGEIFAMGGASERDNLIVTNIVRELSLQMKGKPCKVYSNDMRVKIRSLRLYTYPDVVALCGQARFDDEQKDTLLNPTVIIEVLSKSTEAYDRGEKFERYRKIDCLTEYLMVSQEKHHVDHFVRQPGNHWLLSEASNIDDTVQLSSINCFLALTEIYDKVEVGA